MDIVLAVMDGNSSFVVLFPVRDGKLSGRETFDIQSDEGDTKKDMIAAFIEQYYSQWAVCPPEILVEEAPDGTALLEEYLSQGRSKVRILVPKRGDKKALLDLTKRDLAEMTKSLADRRESRRERENAVYDEITEVFRAGGFTREPGREGKPYRVESYDISNTNGVDSVGAMVVFSGLSPVKKDYRRFKIRTVEGPDDYASLQEVLYRRFRRAAAGDAGFSTLPDIIMMDGGRGQVTVAEQVIKALRFNVPVVGMAKDDSHRTRAIVYGDGSEIELVSRPVLFRYCGTIQEEVHRFAIDYHHNLHGRNAIRSVLDNIEGVGPKRRNALLRHFGTVEAIKKATPSELAELPEITEKVAESIAAYFAKK